MGAPGAVGRATAAVPVATQRTAAARAAALFLSGPLHRRPGLLPELRRVDVESLEVAAKVLAQRRMAERVFHRGLEIPQLAAAVVALAVETVGIHGLLAHQRGDAV